MNKQGTPYKVFTPYWRHCKNGFLSQSLIPEPLPQPSLSNIKNNWLVQNDVSLEEFNLLPENPTGLLNLSTIGKSANKQHNKLGIIFYQTPSTNMMNQGIFQALMAPQNYHHI